MDKSYRIRSHTLGFFSSILLQHSHTLSTAYWTFMAKRCFTFIFSGASVGTVGATLFGLGLKAFGLGLNAWDLLPKACF